MFRKRFLIFCSAVLIASTTVAPTVAFAHGGHHGGHNRGRYTACTTKNCNRTGTHYHNGVCYKGHTSHKGGSYCSNSYHH